MGASRYPTSRSKKIFDYLHVVDLATGLYYHQGGVLGSGAAFLPFDAFTSNPPSPEKDVRRLIVEWVLSSAPEGIRSVWTHGKVRWKRLDLLSS